MSRSPERSQEQIAPHRRSGRIGLGRAIVPKHDVFVRIYRRLITARSERLTAGDQGQKQQNCSGAKNMPGQSLHGALVAVRTSTSPGARFCLGGIRRPTPPTRTAESARFLNEETAKGQVFYRKAVRCWASRLRGVLRQGPLPEALACFTPPRQRWTVCRMTTRTKLARRVATWLQWKLFELGVAPFTGTGFVVTEDLPPRDTNAPTQPVTP